jgi:acetoin utilization deacetylase AcuC-like enzyme
MKAFYADHFVLPLPDGHRFPMSKYRLLREQCEAACPGLALHEALPASDGQLALAHTPHYIDAVARGLLTAAEQREIGFPWSPAMAERARRSVGATLGAAHAALIEGQGVAANLAGGTHHAYAHKGGGYCVFNDVAVSARMMQAHWHRLHRQLLRVAVIDLDVHQGNGTADIFRDDDSVYTLSMHGAKNFPFRKEASNLDVELPDGCSDDAYLRAMDQALQILWHAHAAAPPGLVFFLAGADPHEGDRLGRLKLSTQAMAQRDHHVLDACLQRRIPVVIMMAGGYGHDVNTTVAVHLQSLAAGVRAWRAWHASVPQAGALLSPASSSVA